MVARQAHNLEVARSSPASATISTYLKHRGVEQLVARQAHNLEVARSSPASATKEVKHVVRNMFHFFFYISTSFIVK